MEEELAKKEKEIKRLLNIAYNEGHNNTKSKEFDNWCNCAANIIIGLFDKKAMYAPSTINNQNQN